MGDWINLGEMLVVNAKRHPERLALKDASRSFTYVQCNERVNRLSSLFVSWGLQRGDRVAVLLENCLEIIELYLAAAKTGVVIVPVNYMLVGPEVRYVADNSDARAFFVQQEFVPLVDGIKGQLAKIPDNRYVQVEGEAGPGYWDYEALLADGAPEEPGLAVAPGDTWIMLYTSGTTGVPKGVVRSHESYAAFYLINAVDFRFDGREVCLNVMPLFHVNSTFFTLNVLYMGGTIFVQPARRFDPVKLFETIQEEKITFISLVPTHYHLILNVPLAVREKYDLSSIRKLLCSSAPVRREVKLAIMECFPGVRLYEGYGSTEAGIVTVLKPEEQLEKLGSIGRESTGTALIRLLDEEGRAVPRGEVGELYSRSPMLMDEYYKMPEKTAASFRDGYFTAGDMAYEDEEGYFYLVDRKDNMIITGGEKVFPGEVEKLVCSHPGVFDAAVIGCCSDKWGEVVTAVVICREGECLDEEALLAYCQGKVAAFKRPKRVIFIEVGEMPRSATGKILHRKLRERWDGDA